MDLDLGGGVVVPIAVTESTDLKEASADVASGTTVESFLSRFGPSSESSMRQKHGLSRTEELRIAKYLQRLRDDLAKWAFLCHLRGLFTHSRAVRSVGFERDGSPHGACQASERWRP